MFIYLFVLSSFYEDDNIYGSLLPLACVVLLWLMRQMRP